MIPAEDVTEGWYVARLRSSAEWVPKEVITRNDILCIYEFRRHRYILVMDYDFHSRIAMPDEGSIKRWLVVDKSNEPVGGICEQDERIAHSLNVFKHGFGAPAYRVARFQLIEMPDEAMPDEGGE